MKKIITIILLFTVVIGYCQQVKISKEPQFNGFFIGAMAYTDIYPSPNYILQFNTGISFKTKKNLLFDIVPIQISYIQKNGFKFGSSILLRKYLFKKQ